MFLAAPGLDRRNVCSQEHISLITYSFFCLVTEAHRCEQLAPYAALPRLAE